MHPLSKVVPKAQESFIVFPFLSATRMEVALKIVAMLRPRPKLALAWAPSARLLSYPMKMRFLVGIVAMATDSLGLAMAQAIESPLALPLMSRALLLPPLIWQWVLNPPPLLASLSEESLESSVSLVRSLSESIVLESGVVMVESGPEIHLTAWAGTPPALGWWLLARRVRAWRQPSIVPRLVSPRRTLLSAQQLVTLQLLSFPRVLVEPRKWMFSRL